MLSHRPSPEKEHPNPHAVTQQQDHFRRGSPRGNPRGSQSIGGILGRDKDSQRLSDQDLLQGNEEEAGLMVADFEALWGEGGSGLEAVGSVGSSMAGKEYSSDQQEGLKGGTGGEDGQEEVSDKAWWRARSKGKGSLEEGEGGRKERTEGEFGMGMESSVEESVETNEMGKGMEEEELRKEQSLDVSAKNDAESSEVKVQCDVEEGEVSDSDHEDLSQSDSQQTLNSQVWLVAVWQQVSPLLDRPLSQPDS